MARIFFKENIIGSLEYQTKRSQAEFLSFLDEVGLDAKKKSVIRKSYLDNSNNFFRIIKKIIEGIIS